MAVLIDIIKKNAENILIDFILLIFLFLKLNDSLKKTHTGFPALHGISINLSDSENAKLQVSILLR